MSFLENNIKKCKIGFDGEEIARNWFIKQKIPFMQIDIMFKYQNKWCLGEIKSQEKFKAPPFDGHGLPEWQINRRLEFQNDTNIKAYLIVYDLNDKCLYVESIENLLKGKNFKTKGKKPRVVFDINSFKKVYL